MVRPDDLGATTQARCGIIVPMKSDTEPVIVPAPHGWLALTAPDSDRNIGVVGDDEQQARERFALAVERWDRVARLPEPDGEPLP